MIKNRIVKLSIITIIIISNIIIIFSLVISLKSYISEIKNKNELLEEKQDISSETNFENYSKYRNEKLNSRITSHSNTQVSFNQSIILKIILIVIGIFLIILSAIILVRLKTT